jgi:hypothetical protein
MALLEPPQTRPGLGPLAWLIVVLLLVWNPLSLALVTAAAWPRLAQYGTWAWLLLGVRIAVVVAGLVAARALLDRDARGPRAAALSLYGQALVGLVVALTPYFPSNQVPSARWWWLAGATLVNVSLAATVARAHDASD